MADHKLHILGFCLHWLAITQQSLQILVRCSVQEAILKVANRLKVHVKMASYLDPLSLSPHSL